MSARFIEIYKPAFAELEALHADYLENFLQVKARLSDASLVPSREVAAEIISKLKVRRSKLLPSRTKLLAFNSIAYGPAAQKVASTEKYFVISFLDYFGAYRQAARYSGDQTELLEKLEKQLTEWQGGDRDALAQANETCSEIISDVQHALAVCVRTFEKLSMAVEHALLGR